MSDKDLKMTLLRVTPMRRRRGPSKVKVWIKSAGKDNPTPTQVARNRYGQWKIIECSSIITGVRPSKEEEEDF
jgi:hypothetical protein